MTHRSWQANQFTSRPFQPWIIPRTDVITIERVIMNDTTPHSASTGHMSPTATNNNPICCQGPSQSQTSGKTLVHSGDVAIVAGFGVPALLDLLIFYGVGKKKSVFEGVDLKRCNEFLNVHMRVQHVPLLIRVLLEVYKKGVIETTHTQFLKQYLLLIIKC